MRKSARYWMTGLLGCLLLLVLAPPPVHADGGAPNLAYAAGAGPGIAVIDIAQQKVTKTFTLGGDPRTIYLSLDGRFLYVTQPAVDQVSVLAAKTGQVVCRTHIAGNPSLLAYDPQTDSLFVAGNGSASIHNIDPANCALLHTFDAGGPIYGLALANLASDTQDNQLWVADTTGVAVFGTKSRQQEARIAIPGNVPRYLAIPTGLWVYVSTQQGRLYAIDLNTHRLLLLLSGGQFGTMDFDENTGQIYVPDSLHQQVESITPPGSGALKAPREPAAVYHLDAAPRSVAITSDGQFGFIALDTGAVVMLDVPGRQIVRVIPVGGSPRFIITGLYPPDLGTTPQQATLLTNAATILAYILVAAIILVPLWFVLRQYRHRKEKQTG
jgi:DNA-binding beta-propeller fold protein YncE